MQIGNIVRPKPYDAYSDTGHGPLVSGSQRYEDAVIVRVKPFALASREADMLWTCTVKPHNFVVVGQADAVTLNRGLHRLYGAEGPPGALAHINRHRARCGQRQLDPRAAGWSPSDIIAEAQRLGWIPSCANVNSPRPASASVPTP